MFLIFFSENEKQKQKKKTYTIALAAIQVSKMGLTIYLAQLVSILSAKL